MAGLPGASSKLSKKNSAQKQNERQSFSGLCSKILMDQPTQTKKHLLTVLVEDYFHVGAFENLIQQRNWSNFEPRYEQKTLKTLDLLDRFDTRATFFTLGWIAD